MYELGDDFSKLTKIMADTKTLPIKESMPKKITDLTVLQLKQIIKEVVMEELSKINFTQIQQIQPLPYPQRQPYPWEGPWVSTDNSEGFVTGDSVKMPHPFSDSITLTEI